MLNYYKGKYQKKSEDILSTSCILQRSFHYSGYQVGYLAYGFVMINYTMFIICLLFKLIFIHPLLVKIILKCLAPILILFALKHIIVYCLTKYIFLKVIRSNRNRKENIDHHQQQQKNNQHDIYRERQG